ncbi:[Fe-S]-binding protein, partial [Pseudomonas aeruginosa]
MSLRTSDIPFKDLIERQVHDEVMQKAVANAQETIGRNRQKMVDEL